MISAQDLIEKITSAATCDDCIVVVKDKTQANLRWAASTLTTNGVITERSVTVIAFVAFEGGMASGGVTRTDVNEADIPVLLEQAIVAAKAAGKAQDFAPLAKDISIGNWAAEHVPTGPEIFKSFAPALGDMFAQSVRDKIELFGYAEHTHETTWIGSKGGMRLRKDSPVGRVEMTGKSHERSRSTWSGIETRDFSNVSVPRIDADIRQRLNWQATKVDLPAGRYDTILPSGSVADLFTYMMWVSGARDAFEGQSVFSKKGGGTRVGEKLSNVGFQFFSDPDYKQLPTANFVGTAVSSPFSSVFDNGQPIKHVDWMKDGVLQSLIQTRATAALTSLDFTPLGENAIMSVDGGAGTLSDLISKVDDGLLLTTFWYIRMVDPNSLLLTGLTRDGVYHVKGGEVVGTTNNFRWNDSPVSALNRIAHAGATEWTQPREWAGDVFNMAVPPLVIKDFNMSTVSPGN
ncbi:MAG: metallopeptidase TldD-related protein [Candidatus Planktophila sp.]